MAHKRKPSTSNAQPPHGYEFFGPPGVFIISTVLPLICYLLAFVTNDISGCPPPSLLHPSTFKLKSFKQEIGWTGISSVLNLDAFLATLGWYGLSLLLHAVLPQNKTDGVELASGGKLKYRLNALPSALVTLGLLALGTLVYGSSWSVWTFMYNQYIPILTSNIIIAYALATFVYVRSFSVKATNKDQRELSHNAVTGNMLYDWFMGRELNPRVTLPLFGEVDIKQWCELRPGMLGWLVLDMAFMAAQHRHFGRVTASIIIVTYSHAWYILDSLVMEPAVLTTMDITTDGFGFMLSFGDLVWVPFTYSIQTRYLAVHPVSLGFLHSVAIIAIQMGGYYIFRATNNEKNRFRTNPNDPQISHLQYIETKSGSKLLVSGWWGRARHINYLGDWLMSWAYCLPTALAGYEVISAPAFPDINGRSAAEGSFFSGQPITEKVVPGDAKGWGMLITYFYMIYFMILLIHRERRDEEKCRRKYGKDWDEYCRRVPSRIVPGLY